MRKVGNGSSSRTRCPTALPHRCFVTVVLKIGKESRDTCESCAKNWILWKNFVFGCLGRAPGGQRPSQSQPGPLPPLNHGFDGAVGLTGGEVHVVLKLARNRVERVEVQVWHVQHNPLHLGAPVNDGLAHLV